MADHDRPTGPAPGMRGETSGGVMVCRGCGTENDPTRKFCAGCGAALELRCPTCATANAPTDRFCGECGAALAELAENPPPPVCERRLVTVLFADLVGFTAIAENRDPEEVRDLLSRYFERCRTLIDRYGGVVEKFIGDAVMAVWGTPVAREDDAERAVRAALGLTNAVATLGHEMELAQLRVRAGVLTGRASVEPGAQGEGMVVGDTVNTASRLQAIASPGQVLVDDVTRRASDAAIAYEDAGEHRIKGRERAVHAWAALRVVAGSGGARRGVGLEPLFVGRDRELETVIAASEQSATSGRAGIVTVLGDAGSGKSRLLWEFFKYVDGISDERWWHEGRCLSYGEGVAYWALAEMIRARVGIAEEEPPADARRKLDAAVAEHVLDERERRLVGPRLAHLLGLEERTATEAADLFAGWRLFFERMAEKRPVILAFEDLQWADSGLLDFIDYVLEWAAERPIFILALGRPGFATHRGWDRPVQLGPLPPDAMAKLLDSVAHGLPRELQARILQRADGVPLYAVETVRMLRDRGALVKDGQRYTVSERDADLDVPETLQALITARLDSLDPAERSLLQDASVLGTSFSSAALAAISGRPRAVVERILDLLVARQMLAREEEPHRAEHAQYRFLQAMVRTIALGSLSRRTLRARHLAAADNLCRSAGEAGENAELLAGHYLSAVEADPQAADADAIRERARQTLTAAGRRAVSLALGSEARDYFERAAALAADPVQRAQLLGEAGAAAARAADRARASALLSEAIAGLDAAGRGGDAARMRGLLAEVLIADNRLEEASALLEAARSPLAGEAVSAQLAARRAQVAFLTGDLERAWREGEAALDIADPQGLDAILADAAMTKAIVLAYRQRASEAGALMLLSLQIAIEHDITDTALRAYFNRAELRALMGSPAEASELLDDGVALARERGNRSWERDLLAQRVGIDAVRGHWDDALAAIERLRSAGADESSRLAEIFEPVILSARDDRAALRARRDRPDTPSEWHELDVQQAIGRAIALRAAGRGEHATRLLTPAIKRFLSSGALTASFNLGDVVDALLESEEIAALQTLLEHRPHPSYRLIVGEIERGRGLLDRRRGRLDEARAGIERAVAALRMSGNPYSLARALLDHGTLLLEVDRGDAGMLALHEARELFTSLGADRWLRHAELAPAAASP